MTEPTDWTAYLEIRKRIYEADDLRVSAHLTLVHAACMLGSNEQFNECRSEAIAAFAKKLDDMRELVCAAHLAEQQQKAIKYPTCEQQLMN